MNKILTWRPAPRTMTCALLITALMTISIVVVGCLQMSGQPCPEGGQQCPTGFSCQHGSCEPVGGDGAVAVIHAYLADGVNTNGIREIVVESYIDDSLGCTLGRDPSEEGGLDNRRPNVSAPVNLDEETILRVPAGRNVIFVRAIPRIAGEDVARACVVWDDAQPGAWRDFWLRLWRSDGFCGDRILDLGEQCDHGEGTGRCTSECESIAVDIQTNGCVSEPTMACTWSDGVEEGRCILGWIEDGVRLNVAVRNLDGQNDSGQGFVVDGPARNILLTSHEDYAGLVWVSGEEMRVRTLGWAGQIRDNFVVEGLASSALSSVARFLDRGGDERILVAGWVSESRAILEQVELNERWSIDLIHSPTEDAVAALFSDAIVMTWSEDPFGTGGNGSVVGTGASFEGGASAEDPYVVPDHPDYLQHQPSVVPVDGERAFFIWTDHNRDIEDTDGTGIRGRRLGFDSGDNSVQVNSRMAGNQHSPVVVNGREYLVAAWIDDGQNQLRARYLNNAGSPLSQSFGQGGQGDFVISSGGNFVGSPAIATLDMVYFLWVAQRGSCPEGSGENLRFRLLPPPLQ